MLLAGLFEELSIEKALFVIFIWMNLSRLDFADLPDFENKAPPLKQFRARDGALLSYRFYRAKQQERVILLLHGPTAEGSSFHPFANSLVKRGIGEVYVPNLRGHYASGTSHGHCSYIGQLEDDLFDLIDAFALQRKKIYIATHSIGAGLALRFAKGPYKELIERYVFFSPFIPKIFMGKGKRSIPKIAALSFLNWIGMKKLNRAYVTQFWKQKEEWDGKETLFYSFNLIRSYCLYRPYPKEIKALALLGSQDEIIDRNRCLPFLRKAPIQMVPGARHLDLLSSQKAIELAGNWLRDAL